MKPVTGIANFSGTVPPWKLSLLDSNDQLLAAAVNDFNTFSNYLQDIGGANAIVVSLPPGATATQQAGLAIQVRMAATNTGAVTINIQTVGTYPVVNQLGFPLASGNLMLNGIYSLIFDGQSFQVITGTPGTAAAAGVYLPTFQAGYIQYCGPGNTLAANTNFLFGLLIPNATGVPVPAMLIGAGVPQAAIVTDAVLAGNHGINLVIEAGDAASPSSDVGGQLWVIGGAGFNGKGGQMLVQGGTSLNGPGGDVQIQGGNSTNGLGGNVYIIGGQDGKGGGSIHLIMTQLNGIFGQIVLRVNSVVLFTITKDGAIFCAASGAGLPGNPLISGGPNGQVTWLNTAFTGTVTTAKLTPGGSNGSMTFASGILVAQVQAL
jgi:hypothetical protein